MAFAARTGTVRGIEVEIPVLTLDLAAVDTVATLYYTPFVTERLDEAFHAYQASERADGAHGMAFTIDATTPSLFIRIGVSSEPYAEGDAMPHR